MSDHNSESGLRIYSLGIVANNKELTSEEISVVPIESTPFADGELVSVPFDQETSGEDASGGSYNVKVTGDVAIRAKWLRGSEGNRRTPPDVRRGERVLIWCFADSNEYWWTALNMDLHLRKLETVVFQISATSDEDADPQAVENSYYIEMSSHKKMITLQTSKANDEKCVYVVQLNMAEGKAILCDELGNSVLVNSTDTVIELENAEGTVLQLDKQNLIGYAKDGITLQGEKSITMLTKDFKIQCSTYSLKTNRASLDASQIDITGSTSFNSPVHFAEAVTFDKQITANGIKSSKPIQGPSNTI
jgi:hypothetical protein